MEANTGEAVVWAGRSPGAGVPNGLKSEGGTRTAVPDGLSGCSGAATGAGACTGGDTGGAAGAVGAGVGAAACAGTVAGAGVAGGCAGTVRPTGTGVGATATPSQASWTVQSRSAKTSVYTSQSSVSEVVSWTVSTVAPSGIGRNASTAVLTTRPLGLSSRSSFSAGTARVSTSSAAGPDGSSTVHTSAYGRSVDRSTARSWIGWAHWTVDTTSDTRERRPFTSRAPTPAYATSAAANRSASIAATTAKSLRSAGVPPENTSSAVSARCAESALPEPRTVRVWNAGGTTSRASTPSRSAARRAPPSSSAPRARRAPG
ncbi:hypothetical protein [Kitasatospora fiedleri]|uniref:hypothetical protein n=1 Tax=Kitasatospora fiedleri TaxID=2991545 RepID=UPI00249A5F24|nr:hypothetical protein [Kitasatospora fiedleri]